MTIQEWVESNYLDATINDNIVEIRSVGKFLLLKSQEFVFDSEFDLILSEEEYQLADTIDYLLFYFGDKYYYSDRISKPELKEFKYLGQAKTTFTQVDYPFLGVHGGYDLCNGSRVYEDWCKKAKFLGISTLGIAETNTLAGVVAFQKACEKYHIRGLIGESVRVEDEKGNRILIKLYCIDREVGWKNLLQINTQINVFTKGYIKESTLFKYSKGLICLLPTEVDLSEFYHKYREHFEHLYYQFDLSEWDSQDRDELCCLNVQDYLLNYKSKLKPVLVTDAFYLDKDDFVIQKTLGLISHASFRNQSSHQFFKSIDDYLIESLEIFDNEDDCYEMIVQSIENTIEVFGGIDFKVITGQFYLPKYSMSKNELHWVQQILNIEDEECISNEHLLLTYIEQGFEKKVVEKGLDVELYRKRINYEFDIIKRGGFIDYFLILADIYNYCNENGIWYGIGRGSAAGCLISYLCNIVSVDPIKYGLLFERFLNEGRLGKSLPDVDCDFQGERRPEIKRYIEEKYGYTQVTSIGTYGNFKLKSAVKDIARVYGVEPVLLNFITTLLPSPSQQQPSYFHELFEVAVQKKTIYDFIQQYPEVVEQVPLCLNQPKNASIHAAGVVIVPSKYGSIYEQMPVKEQDGVLVSEWEGHFIDDAGFLKIDVLGVQQLDKFASIIRLIREQLGKEISSFEDIDLEDDSVFELFRQGYNEDVFQLGALGLKAYCKELQPDNIEDLIATVALYRPGPIESGTHKKYIKVKSGLEKSDPDPGCEEITRNTYGLIVYQEQVMQICQRVANFSLVEADDIRKALGKMKPEIVKGYHDTFIERAVKNGYERSKMEILWSKMEAFAAYAFNRSHAACYAITGYYSQWFKVHYPLQFWTTSLQYVEDKERPSRIIEIHKTSSITVSPVDINKSQLVFVGDVETNSIYWALPSVKYVGDKIVESILQERSKGNFFSLEEFYNRTKSLPGVNKRAISHLIISGAFDRLEGVRNVLERFAILERFFDLTGNDLKEEYEPMGHWKEYQWVLKQKELTGFGVFDFNKIIHQSSLVSKINYYRELSQCLSEEIDENNNDVLIVGLLENLIERNYKGGKKLAQLEIHDNTDTIFVTVWDDAYIPMRQELLAAKGSIVLLTGTLGFDNYKKQNIVYSNKTTKIEII